MSASETIEQIVAKATFAADDGRPRRPRVNEFVNAAEPVPNGPGHPNDGRTPLTCQAARWRAGRRFFGRVNAISPEGMVVEEWSAARRQFVAEIFIPKTAHDCIISRCSITAYSLTGSTE